jgi:Circadian oscillating protein COP23
MKFQSLIKLIAVSTLILNITACTSQPPSGKITFSCDVKNGVPRTVARTLRGEVSIIRWVSNFGGEVGYTPQKRCEEVSNRFQQYYNQGILNYITTGRENNYDIICVSSENGGACDGLLFTLKPGESASSLIPQLFDVASLGSGPIEQSSSGISIDFNKLLETALVENN